MNNKIIISIEDKTSDQIFDIEVFPNITVKNLKNKIEELFGFQPGFLNYKFLRCATKGRRVVNVLNDDNKTLFDYHIGNGSKIIFMELEHLGGGGLPMKFSNLKEKEFRNFSKTAPRWRYVGKGLNFFGICGCKMCDAGKKNSEVIYPMKLGINEEFNLINNRDKIKCPICSSFIEPKTIGLYKCEISIYGKYINNDRCVNFSQEFSSDSEDGIEEFKYGEDSDYIWTELIFKINKYY